MSSLDIEVLAETGQAGVGDNHLVLLQEDVASVEVLVDNASRVQVAHGLSHLLGNVDVLVWVEGLGPNVDATVECVSLTEATY